MRLLALAFLFFYSLPSEAVNCKYNVSLSNAVMNIQDSTQVIQQPFVLRREGGSSGNCETYQVYFSKGVANSYQRKATNAQGASVDYNLHSSITMIGTLKQFGDAFNSTEFLQGSAPTANQGYPNRFFVSLPGLNSQTQTAAGIYTDNVQVSFYGVNTGSGNTSLEDVETFTISIVIPTNINISVVDEGASFDPSSTSKILNFGYLSPGQEKAADIRVVSNTPYKIQLSSTNNGSLKHSSTDSRIEYVMKINGAPVGLNGSQSSPVTVGSGNRTSAIGDRYNTRVTITGQTDTKTAGTYEDVITITAIAN